MAFGGAASSVLDLTSAVNVITTMDTTSSTPSYDAYCQAILENWLESGQMLIARRPGAALEERRLSVDRIGGGGIRMEDQAVLEQSARW